MVFQFSQEASAASGKCWDIVAQVSVDTLYGKDVFFVVDIEDVLGYLEYDLDKETKKLTYQIEPPQIVRTAEKAPLRRKY